jgi:hypothetical protein
MLLYGHTFLTLNCLSLSDFVGTIDITILPEVSTEGLESSDVEKLTENVYSMMCQEYEKTSGQE